MSKVCFIIFTFLIINFTCLGQINRDIIFYKNTEIRIYTYLLEKDTIVKAYIDENIPYNEGEINTNFGKMTRNLTFDSICDFVRIKYSNPSITTANLSIGKLIKYDKNQKLKTESKILKDYYNISYVNYYSEKIKIDSSNYINFYEYANSLVSYGIIDFDRIVIILDKCIELNNQFEDAYFLKAKIHESNGQFKGAIASEPHFEVVDLDEINKALFCLNKLLTLNPKNEEAKKYMLYLKNRYKK